MTSTLIYLTSLFLWLNNSSATLPSSFVWKRALPEAQGMSSLQLDELQKALESKGTKKLLIVKNDHIVYEWYAEGWEDTTRKHYSASLAKALVGGTSLLLALGDGLLYPDMPVCELVPEWKKHGQKSKITIRHLATHTSGLEDAEVSNERQQLLKAKGLHTHMDLPGWKGQFWRKDPDPFSVSRDSAAVLFAPGSHFNYSNPGIAMLSYAVTASMKNTEHPDIQSLLWERVYEPLGIRKDEISMGYNKTYEINNLPLVPAWGGGAFTADAAARIGRLMLNKGRWEGRSLVDSTMTERVLEYANTAIAGDDPNKVSEKYSMRTAKNSYPATTMGWYGNFDGVWSHVPRDAFAGGGAGHQLLLVVPSLDLIVVRFGADLADGEEGEGFWSAAEKHLFNPIMDAIVEAPYPQSEFACEFASASEVIRLAEGSDNWPITWAEDDQLYTAYGDGWGFEPKTDIKLSLGLAKVEGSPPAIKGLNIRSNSGERVGQGIHGAKASGLLFVDGTLYMLVRNTDNAQLAWSEDYGRNWSWADWKFKAGFGCPTFLNFGKNYAVARDDYVYIYSFDESSAYQIADQMVMARVPKNKIKEWRAYEYFAGFGSDQSPKWTEDIRKRKAVFSNPGKCYRSGVSYNPGLKKYVWSQIIPLASSEEGPRFSGGLGLFEASEPWGPWETVFYTRKWDIGPGETANIPVKWINRDGKTAYLVFSGEDYFSVRKMKFR